MINGKRGREEEIFKQERRQKMVKNNRQNGINSVMCPFGILANNFGTAFVD